MGVVDFHVMNTDSPFLLSLHGMDRMGVYFKNTKYIVIGPKRMRTPTAHQFGYAFLDLTDMASVMTCSFVADAELKAASSPS